MKLSKEEKEILKHTLYRAPKKLFCGGSSEMQKLVDKGYMIPVGTMSFVPDPYYTITAAGEESLKEEENL